MIRIHSASTTSQAVFGAAIALSLANVSWAQNEALDEVVVTASRSRIPTNLSSVPGSVTIIDAEEIQKQAHFSSDLGDLLGRSVPGLAANSRGSNQNFNQTLRGRKPLVFIDGVPASVATRDAGHDFRLISPSAIGRVEVIRGATALYGLGAGGGLINYATKEPTAGPAQFTTEIGIGSSLTHPAGSTVSSLEQAITGKTGRFSYVTSGFYEKQGGLFAANGSRIPPDPQGQGGIADSESYDVFAKIGIDLTDTQRIFLSGNYFKTEQDSNYTSGVGVYGSQPTPAVPGTPSPLAQNVFTENVMGTVRYTHDDILRSSFNLQGYYSEYTTMFSYDPESFPPQGGVLTTGGQTQVLSDRYGVRVDFNTPLNLSIGSGNLLWGADYAYERPEQSLTDGRYWVPPLTSKSVAPFVQFELPVTNWLTARGGVRYDETSFEVPTFTVLQVTPATPRGNVVQGGSVSFSQAVGNLGFVTTPISQGIMEGYSFYVGFSQGYAIGDFGRALRVASAPSVEAFNFRADVVNNYEVGMRVDRGVVKAELAVYHVNSEYGSTFNNITRDLIRAPERINGLEFQINIKPSAGWGAGASFSINDGKTQSTVTGVWSKLDTTRISPAKLTAYFDRQINEEWAFRLQYLQSLRQDRFKTDTNRFGRHYIEGYGLLDASISGRVGPGRLTFAVNNLLNERYYTPDSWRYVGNTQFTLGEGATAKLSYAISY